MRAIKFQLTSSIVHLLLQRLPSVHAECHQHRVESLPMRARRWSRARNPHRQPNDPRPEHPGVRERSRRHRRREPYGGHGGDAPLARHLAARNPVLRWRAFRDAMPNSAGKYIQVRVGGWKSLKCLIMWSICWERSWDRFKAYVDMRVLSH